MNIVLGITGSISAYKTPWLVRDLRRAGHDVRVVMTPNAEAFVARLALDAVSTHSVIVDPYDSEIQEGGSWHVHLARWADLMVIAPCSASTLAKLATGQSDNALLTVAASLPDATPLVVFPAMDTDMWEKPSTSRNIGVLTKDGVHVIEPASGDLASGLVGKGRLPELEEILAVINEHGPDVEAAPMRAERADDVRSDALHIVITAGPTHEPIDAVRSIINHSSGKMGFALAEAARDRGMLVTLITGPVHLAAPRGVERINVVTAADMHAAVRAHADADVIIMAAAVADFTPAHPAEGKIKKADHAEGLSIDMVPTVDILADVGATKRNGQTIVGFALEQENVVPYAEEKRQRKNADMIVANLAGGEKSGFGVDMNTITIVRGDAPPAPYPPMSKRACAEVIIDHILELRKA
jgi:phosphopantothenoylcysteine decarboxylase / phosphopantothenate---cysteine ligase